MGNGALAALGIATLAALAGGSPRSWADGALAVGSTGDVVRDGIAFGMVVNEPKEKAGETAVKRCRTFHARAAADRCKLVATFSGECFAVAYDPQPGTPGAGWGIGPNQVAANLKAIAMCEEKAGPARRGFCQVESGGCDTTGRADVTKSEPPQPAKSTPQDAAPAPQAPAKTDAKQALRADAINPTNLVTPQVTPVIPELEPAPAPKPKAPAKVMAKERRAWTGANSPLLPIGAMVAVGLAYGLGQ